MPEDSLANTSGVADWWVVYKTPLVLTVVSAGSLVLAGVLFVKSSQNTMPIKFSSDESISSPSGRAAGVGEIVVDVAGAVNKPGVYRLPAGSRVEDAIAAAGGLEEQADANYMSAAVNRAALLISGGKLFIPMKGDAAYNKGEENSLGPASYNTNKNTESQNSGRVSVNSASQSELEALSGIGPVTAGKIIQSRPYQVLEDLLTKKVMSKSLFDKLIDSLSL